FAPTNPFTPQPMNPAEELPGPLTSGLATPCGHAQARPDTLTGLNVALAAGTTTGMRPFASCWPIIRSWPPDSGPTPRAPICRLASPARGLCRHTPVLLGADQELRQLPPPRHTPADWHGIPALVPPWHTLIAGGGTTVDVDDGHMVPRATVPAVHAPTPS